MSTSPLAVMLFVWPLAVVGPAGAATFLVNTTTDAVDATPGDGVCDAGGGGCTLRAAIQEANALAGVDAVTLSAGTYALTIPRLNDEGIARGDLDITQPLTITGASAATTIVDGSGGRDRVFDVTTSATLHGITVQGGLNVPLGGGIRNRGTLALTDVTIRDNDAASGGGLYNAAAPYTTATSTLINVRIENNTATESGGGILNVTVPPTLFPLDSARATVTLTASLVANNTAAFGGGIANTASIGIASIYTATTTIRDNVATGSGGGVWLAVNHSFPFLSEGRLQAVDTTISGNTAAAGGGVFGTTYTLERSTVSDNIATIGGGGLQGVGTITDSTISGNQTDASGGGLLAATGGWFTLRGVTITGNMADADGDGSGDGGGIATPATPTEGFGFPAVYLENTILADNQDPGGEAPDCAGELASDGNNLIGDPGGCLLASDPTNAVGLSAGLGALAANGGPTETHALLPGSPALDAGAGCSALDQRGVARPAGPACDIGAFEAPYVAGACGNGVVDGGETCDDGNVRDGDCCNRLCQHEVGGAACSDGNPCTDDACDGAGTCTHAANAASCTDGSLCTVGAETCTAGACVPGAPRDCSDGDVCTADVCHPQNGCQHPGLTGPACDDGNTCTAGDACDAGRCEGTATTDPCDDGNLCTSADTCANGQCVGIANADPCDDGNVCTSGDQCSNKTCSGGDPVSCPDVCEICVDPVGCAAAPRADCNATDAPRKTSFQMHTSVDPTAGSLQWRWQAQDGTQWTDIQEPYVDPDYELCVFDETTGTPSLVLGTRPRTGLCGTKPCWKNSFSGTKYKDASGSPNGITQMELRARSIVQLQVKAKGLNLALPTMPLANDPGVVVELRRRTGKCWTSRFESPSTNTVERYKSTAK